MTDFFQSFPVAGQDLTTPKGRQVVQDALDALYDLIQRIQGASALDLRGKLTVRSGRGDAPLDGDSGAGLEIQPVDESIADAAGTGRTMLTGFDLRVMVLRSLEVHVREDRTWTVIWRVTERDDCDGRAELIDCDGVSRVDMRSDGSLRTRNSAGAELVKLTSAGGVTLKEQSAPATPPAGYVEVYVKTDGKIYTKDDAGTETGAGGLTSPVAVADGGTGSTTAAAARTALGVVRAGYMSAYPGTSNRWGDWGTHLSVVDSYTNGSSAITGAAFNGGRGFYCDALCPTTGAGFPFVIGQIRWSAERPLTPEFSNIGSAGIRVRFELTGITAGDKFKVRLGIIDKTTAATAHATIYVESAEITADTTWADLTITQAALAGYYAAGDMVRVYCYVAQTAGAGAHTVSHEISGIEADLTG